MRELKTDAIEECIALIESRSLDSGEHVVANDAREQLQSLRSQLGAAEAEKQVQYLRAALRKIMKGEGRYSRDPLAHASNTIEDMAAIAEQALAGTWEEESASSPPPAEGR